MASSRQLKCCWIILALLRLWMALGCCFAAFFSWYHWYLSFFHHYSDDNYNNVRFFSSFFLLGEWEDAKNREVALA